MDNLEKKLILCLVMALLIVAFIPFYWAREPARQEAAIARIQRESVEKGGKSYLTACGMCHGQQAQGGIGPALKGKDATLVQKAVRSGKGIMPAFGPNQISDGELEDIILFLGGLTNSQSPTVPPQTPPVATAVPTPKPPAPASTAPAATSAPPKVDSAVLRAKGQEIFQKTAGGVGCQYCHGADARGTNMGPNIREKSADELRRGLGGDVMSFIRLSDEDIEAVAAYLKYLESQR